VPLAEIAAGLAALINAAGPGFVASVDGSTLVVVGRQRDWAPPSASRSLRLAPSAGFATISTLAGTTRITLGGSSLIRRGAGR
jgi:hypothetical protein